MTLYDDRLLYIASSFDEYCVSSSPSTIVRHLGHNPICFADYIQAWIQSGKGIEDCRGDTQVFFLAVPFLIDAWVTQKDLTDYMDGDDNIVERRVIDVFGGADHEILDPQFFPRWAHYWRNAQA